MLLPIFTLRDQFFVLFSLLFVFSPPSSAQIIISYPNGKYDVAQSTTRLVDISRIDQYDPRNGTRNIMMSLFYPVERKACERICEVPWMPPTTANFVNAFAVSQYGIPNGTLERIRMHTCCKVSKSGNRDATKFPLVLFSPGLGSSRLLHTAQAQKLASAGYAVATMDHTFEGVIVEFPDGTYVTGMDPSFWDYLSFPERFTDAITTRVRDARFVLTSMGNKNIVKRLIPGAKGAFNTAHAAIFGHSFGGATTLDALAVDRRFLGGMNLDGTQFWSSPSNTSTVRQPAILFGRADPNPHNRTNDDTWPVTWNTNLKGWKRELGLKESGHNSFTDMPLLIKLGNVTVTEPIRENIGDLDGERTFEVVGAYIRGFMDMVLKGGRRELFEGESARYPEVLVELE